MGPRPILPVKVPVTINTMFRVSTTSGNQGNQGKLEGIFPVREKSGNLAFFKKIRDSFRIKADCDFRLQFRLPTWVFSCCRHSLFSLSGVWLKFKSQDQYCFLRRVHDILLCMKQLLGPKMLQKLRHWMLDFNVVPCRFRLHTFGTNNIIVWKQ